MTTEIARYQIGAENAKRLKKPIKKPSRFCKAPKHCLGYRLLRGHEEPENWILAWLKKDFDLGQGHSMAIWAVFKSKGWVETSKKKK